MRIDSTKTTIIMKRFTILIFAFLIFSSEKCPKKNEGLDTCKDLPNIEFEDTQIGENTEKTLKFVGNLSAKASIDVKKSNNVSGDTEIKSEFGKEIKKSVKNSQDVSDDFWEQNITLTQLLCFTQAQSKRKDISKEEKKEFNQLLIQIIKDRNDYLVERSKKKVQP